jgi:hypothetical protein
MDQQEALGQRQILLAGGLWRIFVFPLAARPSRQIRHQSDGAHAKQTFKGEYLSLLRKFDIAFKEEYVFQSV